MNSDPPDLSWAIKWLDAVSCGEATMSQRKLTSVEGRCGLEAVSALARQRGVHLLLLTDDRSEQLIAASLHPFRIIC